MTAVGAALHGMLDDAQLAGKVTPELIALRFMADDIEQDGPLGPAISHCRHKQRHNPGNAEFWRRLEGSLKKASTL